MTSETESATPAVHVDPQAGGAHGAFAPLVDPLAYEPIELQRRDFATVVAEELEV